MTFETPIKKQLIQRVSTRDQTLLNVWHFLNFLSEKFLTLFFRSLEYGTPFNEFSQLGELQFYIYPAIDVKAAASNSPSNQVTLSMLGRLDRINC